MRDDQIWIQNKLKELEGRISRLGRAGGPTGTFVARTFSEGAYPTTALKYYAMHPAEVAGDEAEGATGTVTVDAGKIYALNIGTGVPAAGTDHVVTKVAAGRFVFRF